MGEDGSTVSGYAISTVSGIICKAGTENSMCAGGAKRDCAWIIPAPDCDDDGSTTEPPVTTEGATTTPEPPVCVPYDTEGDKCSSDNSLGAEYCQSGETPDDCVWFEAADQCRTACSFDVSTCGVCGCSEVDQDCVETVVAAQAQSARMRVDEYVDETEYKSVNDGEDGAANTVLYVIIGIVGVVVLLLVVLGAFVFITKQRKKRAYFDDGLESDDNMKMDNDEHDAVNMENGDTR